MPVTLGVVSPLVLAGVLLLSALAKLPEPGLTRSAIVALRLPALLDSVWVARAVPVAEVAIAAGLVSPWLHIARYAAWAALALFAAYLVVIARALRLTPRPSCACFGRLGRSQVDRWTLARNVVLVVVTAHAVWFTLGGSTVPATLPALASTPWAVVLGAAVAALILIVVRPGRRPATRGGIEAGERTEPDEGQALDGPGTGAHAAALGWFMETADRPQLLVLVDCYCGPTYRAARELASWQADRRDVDVRLVFSGIEPLTPDEGGAAPEATWTDEHALVWESLALTTSPSGVLLDVDGSVAAGPVAGWDDLVAFVHQARDERDPKGH